MRILKRYFFRSTTFALSALLLGTALLAASTRPYNCEDSRNAKDLFFVQLKNPAQIINNGFVYTLDLYQNNKAPVVCSNKRDFYSGEGLRVRIKSNFDGYAYIVLAQGSTGKRTVLFPPQDRTSGGAVTSASSNVIKTDREYVIPPQGIIRFDNNPGVERILFILSRTEINAETLFSSCSGVSINEVAESSVLRDGISITSDTSGPTPSGKTYVVKSDPSKIVFVELSLNHVAKNDSAGSVRHMQPVAPAVVPSIATSSSAIPSTKIAAPSVPPASAATSINTMSPSIPAPTRTPASIFGVPYSIDVAQPATETSSAPSPPKPPPDQVNRPVTDKWAVVVGLSRYRDSSMNLKAPRKDADAFASYLTDEAGFAQSHVIKIYDQDATRENILEALSQLGQKVRADDLFVFYANCHGSAETETPGNFLLLYDYAGEASMGRQLLMQDLSSLLKSKVPSERMVLIVQSCHSGYVKAGKVPSPESLSSDLMGIGRIVATACTTEESSWVYKRGGIFTMALIPNLRKYSKLKEALAHTQSDVIAETESERKSRQMHPVVKYDLWIGDDAVLNAKPTDPQP